MLSTSTKIVTNAKNQIPNSDPSRQLFAIKQEVGQRIEYTTKDKIYSYM